MKKGNYTPGPWAISNEGDILAEGEKFGFKLAKLSLAANVGDADLIASAPELNERLIDNTAMIIRLHCILTGMSESPEYSDIKNKIANMCDDIESCVVRNREALMKANGLAGAVGANQDNICGPLKETF